MAKHKPPKSRRGGSAKPPARKPVVRGRQMAAGQGCLWLFGTHPVLQALANPRRRVRRLLVTAEAAKRHDTELTSALARREAALPVESASREELAELLPEGAVHQGLALEVEPLEQPWLEDLLDRLAGPEAGPSVLVALDQVTDPQNVGAILRSAAAFGAAGVIATRDHAAPESGTLAKAASGALEHVPYVQVTNLARAFDQLKERGFWVLGLAAGAGTSIAEWSPGPASVLALGAEGSGLRRLTRERCDQLLRLPTQGPIGQLNVSNAAAVALYELLARAGG